MWKVALLTVLIIALAVAAIGIKLLVKKDGEFKKTCSSVDPTTGNRLGCTCGNSDSGTDCDNKAGG